MTSKYVFIGSKAQVAAHNFTEFGQVVDLDPAEATALVLNHNLPILPAEEFAGTEGEDDRPLAARIALHHYREELRAPAKETIHERI